MQAPPGTLPAHLAGQEQQQAPSIRDALSSAFKQGGDNQQQEQQQQAPAADPNAPAPGSLESRHRADGTFKSQAELDADTGPERISVTEPSIRAGLHHAKRLMAVPRVTTPGTATLAMWRAMAGFDSNGNQTIPDALREPADGQSEEATEDSEQ